MRVLRWISCALVVLVSASAWAQPVELTREHFARRLARVEAQAAGARGAEAGFGRLGSVFKMVNSARELRQAYERLTEADARFEPNYSPEGMPQLPSSCLDEGDAECLECFDRAYRELDFLRYNLEQLRAHYGAAVDFAKKAIAFGDNVSGIHGAMGLGWQYERVEINKAVDKLGVTYDEKYRGMMGTLRRTLEEIARCEAEHFGEGDWYRRFGFMYYTFMEERYRRSP